MGLEALRHLFPQLLFLIRTPVSTIQFDEDRGVGKRAFGFEDENLIILPSLSQLFHQGSVWKMADELVSELMGNRLPQNIDARGLGLLEVLHFCIEVVFTGYVVSCLEVTGDLLQ